MLMGRRTRTTLPTRRQLLKPNYNAEKIRVALQEKQTKQKLYYDRTAKLLEPLIEQENVRMRDETNQVWLPATVKKVNDQPRSYTVEAETGGEYRRNRKELLQCGERKSPVKPETHTTLETKQFPPLNVNK